MNETWRTPPRRSEGAIEPMAAPRSPRQILVDRVGVGTILTAWLLTILSISAIVVFWK